MKFTDRVLTLGLASITQPQSTVYVNLENLRMVRPGIVGL